MLNSKPDIGETVQAEGKVLKCHQTGHMEFISGPLVVMGSIRYTWNHDYVIYCSPDGEKTYEGR